ncbi:hypothetical protein FORMA_18720 [Formosa sp. Hel3_A1_48]|nr:hypothetical protein FORMA_18720 [Formosa sp. Hel3_A1_48]
MILNTLEKFMDLFIFWQFIYLSSLKKMIKRILKHCIFAKGKSYTTSSC